MRQYIVTIKVRKDPAHNPYDKKTQNKEIGSTEHNCTDATGEHHSMLVNANGYKEAESKVNKRLGPIHITRIEQAIIIV